MNEPYKMIVVNLIGSLILILSLFIYKFWYPKKKINLFYLLILISILPIISIFRPGAYESGDFNIHIYRSIEFFRSLMEGNIIPSWSMNLNATFGYPLFTFNYVLPYYLISFLHLIGFSFIASMKGFLIINMFLSGVFMYLFSKELFKNEIAAFTASIFYLFFPYHLISVHFKVTIGEILIFTLIPLLFLSIYKLSQKSSIFYILSTGLIFGLMFLSHIYMAIMLIPILFLLPLIFSKQKLRFLFHLIISIGISIVISSFQWLPSLIYKSYLFTSRYPVNIDALYYPNISDLLFAPWRFGLLFQGPKGEISSLIGYAQLIVLITFIFLFLKNKIDTKYKKYVYFFMLLIFALILLVNPISKELWNKIPLLSSAGSHRLLILIGFFISILSGYFALLYKNKKLIIYSLIIFAIATTMLNWGQRRVIPEINDSILISNLPLTTANGEAHFYANSKWVNKDHPWFSVVPTQHIEIINGNGTVKELSRISTKHVYEISSKDKILIRENTLYFPGWQIQSNNKDIKLFPDKDGIINFYLPSGVQRVTVYYQDFKLLTFSKIISLLTIFLSLFFILGIFLRNHLSFFQRFK